MNPNPRKSLIYGREVPVDGCYYCDVAKLSKWLLACLKPAEAHLGAMWLTASLEVSLGGILDTIPSLLGAVVMAGSRGTPNFTDGPSTGPRLTASAEPKGRQLFAGLQLSEQSLNCSS